MLISHLKRCIYLGLDLSGNLMFVGTFNKGLPTGYCWLAKEGQGWLFGEVDENGSFSGDNIAYIYPDLLTAITGTFLNEVRNAFSLYVQMRFSQKIRKMIF